MPGYPPASLTYAHGVSQDNSAGAFGDSRDGFLVHADHQVGWLIALPWPPGELDSTLITVISGNGAEGRVSGDPEADEQKGEH